MLSLQAPLMDLYLTKDNQQLGPYSLADVQAMVAAGTVQPTDLAWYEGQTTWVPLNQVPGFAGAHAAGPVRRPVLVWVICIFYFICVPLGLIAIAASPFLLSYSSNIQHHVEENLQSQMERTTDPNTKERLAGLLQRIRDGEARTARTANQGPGYYVFAVANSLISLTAAVFLFRLRRAAFYLFLFTFAVGLLYSIYSYTLGGMLKDMPTPTLMIALVAVALSWGISLAIIIYVGLLFKRGVLR